MTEGLEIWTVYDHPRDFPDEFVARLWINDQRTDTLVRGRTLDEVRELIPFDLTRMPRMEGDDPVIVETWF